MTECDVLVVGAGVGGICAAVQAARLRSSVLMVEKASDIGGTGVHSPVGLVCKFHRRDTHEPITRGLHQELFQEAYAWQGEYQDNDVLPTYDHRVLRKRYKDLIDALPNLEVITSTGVVAVTQSKAKQGRQRIEKVSLEDGREVKAKVFVDGTADGNLAALADAPFFKGRASDGRMQSATLTFALKNFDVTKLRNSRTNTWGGYRSLNEELTEIYLKAKADGATSNPKYAIYAFAYPNGQTLLFNCNEVADVDPTLPESVVEARKLAEQYVEELISIIRRHPAFSACDVDFVSPKYGVREGRRIIGDYILTGKDCLNEARFKDAVAAGAYDIDIHDPDGKSSTLKRIPNTQYYHIPYRCLIARDHENLLLSSRCLSGDFEAHSSYRVMSCLAGVGQAAGAAATLACQHAEGCLRNIRASWIRYCLHESGQWTEGPLVQPEEK